jgi:hypothetical protein
MPARNGIPGTTGETGETGESLPGGAVTPVATEAGGGLPRATLGAEADASRDT